MKTIRHQEHMTNFISTVESIDFQRNDWIGPELESVFLEIYNVGEITSMTKEVKTLVLRVETLILKRFGLKIVFTPNDELACCWPAMFVRHHTLTSPTHKDYYNIDTNGKVRLLDMMISGSNLGSIDFKTAKVSGWFSTVESAVHLNLYKLVAGWELTIPEAVAVFLHEIGHIFNAVSYCARFNKTNQIVADLVKHVLDKDYAKVRVIYRELNSLDGNTYTDITDDLTSGDAVALGKSAVGLFSGVSKSLSGASYYDETSFESGADAFVTRMGYGHYNAVVMEWMFRVDPDDLSIQRKSRLSYMFLLFSTVASIGIVLSMLAAGPIVLASVIASIAGLYTAIVRKVLNSWSKTSKVMDYDETNERMRRVKHQLIESLKRSNLPVTEQKHILFQIKDTDDMLVMIPQKDPLLARIADRVFLKDRLARKGIEAQREIESFISNDIFTAAKSLELKKKP